MLLFPPEQRLLRTEAVLYLDDLSYALAGEVDIDGTLNQLAEAMRNHETIELRIITAGSDSTRALVKPGNARIVYLDEGPYSVAHGQNELGKPDPD